MSAGLLYFNCLSFVCAVGLSPQSAAAAMRAGISGFAELNHVDNRGEPIIGARVPGLDDRRTGRSRTAALLTQAFTGVEDHLPQGLRLQDLPLVLCTGEPERPGVQLRSMVADVEATLQVGLAREGSSHVGTGAVSGFQALVRASEILQDRRLPACLVAAADCLTDARTLQWLDASQRLKTSAQLDGLVPGEGAAVMLVSTEPLLPHPLALRGLGFGVETATVLNDQPLLGKGLTQAARTALAQASLDIRDIAFRLSDIAGESYAFEEVALAQSRLTRVPRETQDLWLPGSSIGECGAVAAFAQFAWAEQAFARSYAPGPHALAHGSAAWGPRAVAVLEGQVPHVA